MSTLLGIFSMYANLLLLCCVLLPVACRLLLWAPNNEGIFSQFLQLRVMNHISQDLKISAILIPHFNSSHFHRNYLNLCIFFRFPQNVNCIPDLVAGQLLSLCSKQMRLNLFSYYKNSSQVQRESVLMLAPQLLCHEKLSVPFLDGRSRRDAFLRSVSLPALPLLFTTDLELLFENLLITTNPYGQPFAVVHWRRGDQLKTRCLQGKDTSTNCRSAQQFLTQTRLVVNETSYKVFVVSNEDQESAHMAYLLRNGLNLFPAQKACSELTYMASDLCVLAMEVQLMLRADTFVGWGVSIINDVVEHERFVSNRTWCTATETEPPYPTWCWLQQQRIVSFENANIGTLSMRDFLLQEDKKMLTQPLILSDYNTTSMPIYQEEIKKAIYHSP
jgi:hypothetical protein